MLKRGFEMKYVAITIFVTMMLLTVTTWAKDSKEPRLNSNDPAIHLLEGTMSRPIFVKPPFKPLETDLRCLKFLKLFSNMEYGIEKETWFPGQKIPLQKQSLVTRFQLFDKPIYLTFSISK